MPERRKNTRRRQAERRSKPRRQDGDRRQPRDCSSDNWILVFTGIDRRHADRRQQSRREHNRRWCNDRRLGELADRLAEKMRKWMRWALHERVVTDLPAHPQRSDRLLKVMRWLADGLQLYELMAVASQRVQAQALWRRMVFWWEQSEAIIEELRAHKGD